MQDLDKFKNEMNLSGQNVYVGHRYVPKIMGDWNKTKTYEPLSIVQYQGNSFTSRQYVPVGVEITNEEYWASTGNYNAQIEQYRQDVRNLENDVNNINDEVISARDGEATLNERLDKNYQEVTTQLADNSLKHEDIVYLNNFEKKATEMYDTERLQRALDYAHENGLKHLSITKDLTVHQPVEIYADYLTIFGPTINDYHVKIKTTPDFGNKPIFDVKVEGVSFQNLNMTGDNDVTLTAGEAIGVRYDFRIPDCDSYIINCNFRYLKYGVKAKGRNVRMVGNTFALVNFPITLNKFGGDAQYGNDIRGFWIKDNIFHSCGAPTDMLDFATILTVTDVTVGQDIIFEGNKIEGALNTIFKGAIYGVKFKNNDITAPIMGWGFDISNTPTTILNSGVRFGEITNNNFIGASGGTTTYDETMHFIKGGLINYLNIHDNVFNSSTEEAIIADDTNVVSIKRNTFRSISYKNIGEYDIVKVNNAATNTFVDENNVFDNSYKHFVYVGGNLSQSSVHNNNVPLNHEKMEVVVKGNPGAENVNVAMSATQEVSESVDTRNTFAGAEIHRKDYKRVNPQDDNKKTMIARERKLVEPFDSSADETIVNGGMAFDVADNGVMKEVVKFTKYGVKVEGAIAFGTWRMWIDSTGNVRKKNGIPTSDTDGTIV